MTIKIGVFFILTILIPTALLARFGLLAVESEKAVVERNMRQKYEAMADIAEEEIRTVLSRARETSLNDPDYWESALRKGVNVFKDEVFLFDAEGKVLGGAPSKSLDDAVFIRRAKGLPYGIAVYERHPLLLENWEAKKDGPIFYISIIIFAAFSIVGGSIFTLSALTREWRQAKLKSEFASHLSHDLRRPLTSIRMFSEMLSQDRVPSEEKRQEYYRIISEESDKLTHLANNILDFSRIEEGKRKYNIRREDIARVARETVERFKVYTIQETRSVKLQVQPQAGGAAFPMVRVDAGAISQALMNLLTNADKYSPGDKEIVVYLRRDRRRVVIEVVDQGFGIPKRDCKKIFQKFYRSLNEQIGRVEGSGLGLALVKYTVQAHRGKVTVESEEGRGSKFSIVLPI
jgi:signal transduction histidine kinase